MWCARPISAGSDDRGGVEHCKPRERGRRHMSIHTGLMWKSGLREPPIDPTGVAAAIRGKLWLLGVVFAFTCLGLAGRVGAQGPTVDTSVPGLPGSSGSLLGRAPGAG